MEVGKPAQSLNPYALRTERLVPEAGDSTDINSMVATMQWWDRFAQIEVEDCLDRFKRLRNNAPVARGWGMDFGEFVFPDIWAWHDKPSAMTLTYDAAIAVLRNDQVFSHNLYAVEFGEDNPIFQDGEAHLQARRLLQAGFGPVAANNLLGLVDDLANELIDEFVDSEKVDLVGQYSSKLTSRALTRWVGQPVSDANKVASWAIRQMAIREPQGLEAARYLAEYIVPIIENRRSLSQEQLEHRDDLVSILARVEGDGKNFSNDALRTLLQIFFIGGIETTFKAISASIFFMLTQKGVWNELKQNRNLVTPLIEESVRLSSPNVCGAARLALEDTEVEGVPIEKGTGVLVNISMANRDESRWDDAWNFNLHRKLVPGMAFGTGPHACLGKHVGRIMVQSAVNALLNRFDIIQLDEDFPEPGLKGLGTLYCQNLNVVLKQ